MTGVSRAVLEEPRATGTDHAVRTILWERSACKGRGEPSPPPSRTRAPRPRPPQAAGEARKLLGVARLVAAPPPIARMRPAGTTSTDFPAPRSHLEAAPDAHPARAVRSAVIEIPRHGSSRHARRGAPGRRSPVLERRGPESSRSALPPPLRALIRRLWRIRASPGPDERRRPPRGPEGEPRRRPRLRTHGGACRPPFPRLHPLDPTLEVEYHSQTRGRHPGQTVATVRGHAAPSSLPPMRTGPEPPWAVSAASPPSTRDLVALVAPYGAHVVCTRKNHPRPPRPRKYAVRCGGAITTASRWTRRPHQDNHVAFPASVPPSSGPASAWATIVKIGSSGLLGALGRALTRLRRVFSWTHPVETSPQAVKMAKGRSITRSIRGITPANGGGKSRRRGGFSCP